jgi:hydroxysqualene dehydroxylase
MAIEPSDRVGWTCDGEPFDSVVLACTAIEAARLVARIAPQWAKMAEAVTYEPIITVYLSAQDSRWPAPMIALAEGPERPAQFGFDLGAIDASRRDRFAFVVSGAGAWLDRGLEATSNAVLAQARSNFPGTAWTRLRTLAERRATFVCRPGLQRPPAAIAPGLQAAGDYVEGPYPATLEGSVRSGIAAARQMAGA